MISESQRREIDEWNEMDRTVRQPLRDLLLRFLCIEKMPVGDFDAHEVLLVRHRFWYDDHEDVEITAHLRHVDMGYFRPGWHASPKDKTRSLVRFKLDISHQKLTVKLGFRYGGFNEFFSSELITEVENATPETASEVLYGALYGVLGPGPPQVFSWLPPAGPPLLRESVPGLVAGEAERLRQEYQRFLQGQAMRILEPCKEAHSEESVDALVPYGAELVEAALTAPAEAGAKRPRPDWPASSSRGSR